MTPFRNNIFIEPEKVDSVLVTHQNRIIQRGTVVAVGKDVLDLKVGDKVLFESYITKFDINGVLTYSCVEDSDLIRGYERL